jgi:hypothetical protein
MLGKRLQGYNPVNGVGAKHAELTLVISAEVNLAAATFGGAGQSYLVNGAYALAIFVFKQNNRLSRHGRREAKVGKLNYLAA